MHPNHKFEEDPFSQTSSTSFVGDRISNSESFDPLVDIQSQINAIVPTNIGPLTAQVATNTANIATNTASISSLNTNLNTANASFQAAYVGGVQLTQDSAGTIPLYVWSHT